MFLAEDGVLVIRMWYVMLLFQHQRFGVCYGLVVPSVAAIPHTEFPLDSGCVHFFGEEVH